MIDVEEEKEPEPTPEELERQRLRREFLMSGVPEELKRQIASTAMNTLTAEFPPIPSDCHTQQLADVVLPPVWHGRRCYTFRDTEDSLDVDRKDWSVAAPTGCQYQHIPVIPFKVDFISYCLFNYAHFVLKCQLSPTILFIRTRTYCTN